MKTIRRLQRLEGVWSVAADGRPRETMRVVVGCVCGPTNLAASTCHRRIDPTGLLVAVVELDGSSDSLTVEDLERFVEGFPIEAA
jgi:hypothetical protein